MSNEKSAETNTIQLIFAPAAAAIEIIKGTGNGPGAPFANAGYDPDEPRVPAGQPGGGQWMSGDPGAADREAKRATEARRSALSAAEYRKIAEHMSHDAPVALKFGTRDDYDRYQAAAKSARDLAEEMNRRAYILEHGKEDDYRPLMLEKYGINNPELNKIAAYYAGQFNDQATLNRLKLQHPYIRSKRDGLNFIASIAMMLMGGLVTDLDGAPEEGAGSLSEKSALDQTSDTEESSANDEKGGAKDKEQPGSTAAQPTPQRGQARFRLVNARRIETLMLDPSAGMGWRHMNYGNTPI